MKQIRNLFVFMVILVMLTAVGCASRKNVVPPSPPSTTGNGIGETRDYRFPDNDYTSYDINSAAASPSGMNTAGTVE